MHLGAKINRDVVRICKECKRCHFSKNLKPTFKFFSSTIIEKSSLGTSIRLRRIVLDGIEVRIS